MLMKINARGHANGLPLRGGSVARIVQPGPYWERSILQRLLGPRQAEPIGTVQRSVAAALRDRVLDEMELRQGLARIDLSPGERALVKRDGRLAWVLGPGRHVFWDVPANLSIHTDDLSDDFPAEAASAGQLIVESVRVEPDEQVRLVRDGQVIDELRPGIHSLWNPVGSVDWVVGRIATGDRGQGAEGLVDGQASQISAMSYLHSAPCP